jgi:very-short-patch-repair endonuclease
MRTFGPKHRADYLTAKQLGLITRAQSLQVGISVHGIARRLASGEWIRVHENVYRLASAPVTIEQMWLAACLRRPGSVWLSHRAAAAFWKLDGFEQRIVEVTTVCDLRSDGTITVHRIPLMPRIDATSVANMPVTTVHRTLIDLGSVASPDDVELALDCALRRRITSNDRLLRRLQAISTHGRRGPAVLRSVLDKHSGRPTDSALETRFAQFLRLHNLPEADKQVTIYDDAGFVARVDFFFEVARAIVEVDGRNHHLRRRQWEHDLRRRNRLTAQGYRVLHVTAQRLRNDAKGIERELCSVLKSN